MKQAGATVVSQSDRILSVAEGLAKLPVPAGGRVAILADGGGHGTVTIDALVDAGVELAELSEDTKVRLRDIPAAGRLHRQPGRCRRRHR